MIKHAIKAHSSSIHVGKTDEAEPIKITLGLRRRPDHYPLPTFDDYLNCPARPRLPEDVFAKLYGADPADVAEVVTHYERTGFTVDHHLARREIYLVGTVGLANRTFGFEVHDYERRPGEYVIPFRKHHGDCTTPNHLDHIILHVRGMDTEPPVPHARVYPPKLSIDPDEVLPPAIGTPPVYTNLNLGTFQSIYNIPNVTSTGQGVAIILYGGWGQWNSTDLQSTMSYFGLPYPSISNVIVDSSVVPGPGVEDPMDVATIATFAPGAAIGVYWAATAQDFFARLIAPVAGDPHITVISYSACSDEQYSADAFTESQLEDIAIIGITACASSGDWGTTLGQTGATTNNGREFVAATWMAANPYVLATGGTVIGALSGNSISNTNFVEWCWNEDVYYNVTGGAVSTWNPQPNYQNSWNIPASIGIAPEKGTVTPGRGVPDISANASSKSSPLFYYNGSLVAGGGTSQSCPIIASEVCIINAVTGRSIGFVNPTLYNQGNNSAIIRRLDAGGATDNSFLNASITPNSTIPGYPVNLTGWGANVGLGVLNVGGLISYLESVGENVSLIEITATAPIISGGLMSLVQGAPLGTVLCNLTAVCNFGIPFTGTIVVSSAFSSFLNISNGTVTSNYPFGIGTYSAGYIATQAGLSGSPLTQFFEFNVIAPTITGITLSHSSVTGNSPAGTVVGAITVQLDAGAFAGTLSLGGTNAASFGLDGSNNLITSGVLTQGSYNVNIIATQAGATGSPFTLTTPITVTAPLVTITEIVLGGSSVSSTAPVGTAIGTITVQTTGGSFTGSLSLSGTDAASFQISGSSLVTNAAMSNSSYSINIVATQAGAVGSPFILPETISVTVAQTGLSLTLTGPDASRFQIVNNQLETVGGVPAGTYSINIVATEAGATGSPFTAPESITSVATLVITGITLSNSTFTANSASGTVVGFITVQETGGAFSGTLSVSGANASSFAISGSNLVTKGVVAAGTYGINLIATQAGASGSPFTSAVTLTSTAAALQITGINLVNASLTGGAPSGTVAGTISVQAVNGTFAGTLSITGTNASSFAITGASPSWTLVTSGVVQAGTYSINLVATQAGATGSPFTAPESIVAVSGLTITGITLSAVSFPGSSPSGTVVGSISVQETGGTFSGSLSLSGTNASSFTITSGNLLTTVGVLAPATYNINIVATQSGATGSPFTAAQSLTATPPATYTYVVSTASSASGPWTQFNTVSVLTDVVSALTPNTSYFFQVIPVNSVTQQQGPPTVVGPVLTQSAAPVFTITVTPVGTVNTGSTFLVTGSLTGYTAVPQLSYADDGGGFTNITTGTTLTSFSFTHPAVTVGSHTTVIQDSAHSVSNSTNYTAVTVPLATFRLNELDVTPGISLSNGGLTATVTASGPQGVRTNTALNPATSTTLTGSGFTYLEVTVNSASEHWSVGLVTADYNLADPHGIGQATMSGGGDPGQITTGFFPCSTYQPGRIYANTGYSDPSQSPTQSDTFVIAGKSNTVSGDTIGIAINLDLFFSTQEQGAIDFTSTAMKRDGLFWNSGYQLQNTTGAPTTNYPGWADLGIFVSVMFPSPYYIAFKCSDIGAQATFNFGATPFVFPNPLTGWGSTAPNYLSWTSNAATPPFPVPISTIGPPRTFNALGATTTGSITVTWQPPATGAGPFTYTVQHLTAVGGFADAWTTVATTASSSATVSVATSFTSGTYRVSANGGLWSKPRLFHSVIGPTEVVFWSIYPSSATATSITYTLQPAANFASYNVYYCPLTTATRINPLANIIFPLQNNGFTSFGSIPASTSSITISSLVDNTGYFVAFMQVLNGVEQNGLNGTAFVGSLIYGSTLPTAGFTGGIENYLIPPGAETYPWGGGNTIIVPVGTTTHFAVYYDTWIYDATTGPAVGNHILSVCESIYNQCVTWFGVSSPNHTPTIETSINPTGSLINVVLTAGQAFGGAHLTCLNADIMVNAAVNADVGYGDLASMLLVAELTEVFMPSLTSLPDCDQHTIGEGLSCAMAFALYPNGVLVANTSLNTAAWWLNQAVNVNNVPSGYTDPVTGLAAVGPFTSRNDYVNTNLAGESLPDLPGIGCACLFFGYLTSQLGFSFTQICTGLNQLPANATLRALHNLLTNTTVDPFPAFLTLLNNHFPPSTQVDQLHFTQNPFPLT